MYNLDFTPEQLVAVYRNTSNEGRTAIKEALGDKLSEALPITERVKTYQDAVRELGEKHPYVEFANSAEWRYEGNAGSDIIAYLKLRVITAALNEGWEPQFTENERRWFPWFELFTKEEIDGMDEDEKSRRGLLLWGGNAHYGSRCGLASATSSLAWSPSPASVGSRLAFKSEELADYAGRQFTELYAGFCFIPNPEKEKEK